ncbi:MAG: RagB/SusD family nutrient uptake outer membrane protein [Prevotella sp.]|nr:RagB/SusD family nutrient uptake outer membrane protein [Prevotella sp.]
MKYSINKITAGALLAVAALTVSCSSDYLDTAPSQSVNPNAAYATTENARNTLNGIAKTMTTQYAYYGQGFAGENAVIRLYENLPSQNYNYNRYASGWAPIHNHTFHTNSTRIYDSYAWAYYYSIIVNANALIEGIDKSEGPDADKKFIKASAMTFRAYAYEKLAHYYCFRWQDSNNGAAKGLPLRLDTSNGDLPASTLAETYQQIYKDCDDAIKLFTESGKTRSISECWIPDLNTAHAVYARAALTRQDYATALTQAKLAEDKRALMKADAYAAGFYKPNDEWILGSYGNESEQNWYWAFGVQDACNGYYATNQDTGAGTIGHELISRIPNNDARKQLFITEDKFSNIDIHNDDQVNQTYGILGMRNDNVWEQADSIVKAHQLPGLSAAYAAGYMYLDGQMKFWTTAQPGVCYVPFIRASEMVLIEAEANYFLGNTADAQAALVKLNATTGRNPNYTCTKTGQDLFNEIKDYREVELWGEGFGWSDYKRWNIPIVRHSFAQGGNAHVAVAKTINPDEFNQWTWVVPSAEIDYNSKLKDE